MSTTYTTNVGLGIPALNDNAYVATWEDNLDLIDALGAVGPLAVTFAERPSSTLNVKVAAGSFRKNDGTVVTYAGTAAQAMTASQTNYVYLTNTGTLTVNTTGFPASTDIVRLAVVVAGGSTITSVTDARLYLGSFGANGNLTYLALAGGTFADSGGVVTVTLGTTNGVKFGAGATDKLGFYGATPVVQPAHANQGALTDSTGGTAAFTLVTLSTLTDSPASADALRDELISLWLPEIENNFASVARLVNRIRTELVALGLIKGSA